MVDSFDDALNHIEEYGSGHSEAIVTENYTIGMRFLNEVDAACVYLNASTRFTEEDSLEWSRSRHQYSEISCLRPMGLKELTTYKWVIFGADTSVPKF